MGRDTKAELQKCLRHNTALMAKVEAQDAEIERLRALLLSALPHVEVEGDDTLATIIRQELSQRREPKG